VGCHTQAQAGEARSGERDEPHRGDLAVVATILREGEREEKEKHSILLFFFLITLSTFSFVFPFFDNNNNVTGNCSGAQQTKAQMLYRNSGVLLRGSVETNGGKNNNKRYKHPPPLQTHLHTHTYMYALRL
jgi:hypothetical protein